jgi:hypothetical protein
MYRTNSFCLNLTEVVLLTSNCTVAATSVRLIAECDDFPRGALDATAMVPIFDHEKAHDYRKT